MGVVVLAVAVFIAAYIPAVQQFAIGKASEIVARETGWKVTVEKFRLRFPLGLSVHGTTVVTPENDTLARVNRGRVHVALGPLLKGRVRVTDIAMEDASVAWRDTVSGMTLRARIDGVTAGTAVLDPAGKSVRLTRAEVDGGEATVAMGDTPKTDTIPFNWKIEVGRFELRNFAFAVDMPGDSAPGRFDYKHIRAEGAGVAVSNFSFHEGNIEARFEGLHLVERSGMRVVNGGGDFMMNGEEGFSLKEFSLETAASKIKGAATAGFGAMTADPRTPVSVNLYVQVATDEIALFTPLPHRLDHKTVELEGAAGGTLGDVVIEKFTAAIPGTISIEAQGTLRSMTTPERLAGSVTIESRMADIDFARSFITDRNLRNRIAIPRNMTLRAGVDFSPERYDLRELVLRVDTGRLDAKGSFEARTKRYRADLMTTGFPLGRFLPRDSLGAATISLTAEGRGVDPTAMVAKAALKVERLDWNNHNLGRITADIAADAGEIKGRIRSRNELIDTDITLDGLISVSPEFASRRGESVPLDRMNYTLAAQIDSTVVRLSDTLKIKTPITLKASASPEGTAANLRSGDMAIDVSSPLPPDSLFRSAARTGSEISRQLAARHLNADSLQSAFPQMTMTARAGTGNFLHDLAGMRGVGFRKITANVETADDKPFHIDATATGIVARGVEVDTLRLHALRNKEMLDYEMRLANRPNNVTDIGLIRVRGSAGGRTMTANILQQNTKGEVGFDFGVRASLKEKQTIRAEMGPAGMILGYEPWTVHPGTDWVEYDTEGRLRADLHISSMGLGVFTAENGADILPRFAAEGDITLTSDSLPGIPQGALRLAARGLDLGAMLDLFPTAPAIGGIISSDMVFGFHRDPEQGNIIAARGTLGAKDFSYERRRVADVDTDIDFGADGAGRMVLDATVKLEKQTAMTAKGTYAAGTVDFDVNIPAVPLAIAQNLMPPETALLKGALDGKLHMAGDPAKPDITGDVGFTGASAEIALIGTTLGISTERITIADNRVKFNNWGIVAPNGQKLTVGGGIDITRLDAPAADLTIRTRDFRMVDSRHVGGSQIYGTAAIDANITARGTFDAMRVRGDIGLDGASNIVYIMRATSTLKDEKQHIVEFVRFAADSLDNGGGDEVPLKPLVRGGVDVLLGIDIEDGLRATLSLDEQNDNRVALVGGGNLVFSMNRQGDTRMAGRYTMSGGTLYYKPPMIPQKIFNVSDGSYVEWAGAVAEPRMNIAAKQSMEVSVQDEGGAREVAFDISVAMTGSLAKLGMAFDLAAPADIEIQDQLMAMSPEEKMQQAISLLAFNQYTGPGYSSRGMAFDARNQLGNFVSREISQWARNNLKGVDFSMGIDTRDDGTGVNRTDYSYSVTKSLFSDRVKISIGGKVSDDAAASSQGFTESLFEDVILEYRLTRRDNMFIKIYRYNTRESILEGEVTETGAGFIIRKKINRLGDIFRRTRPRSRRIDN